MESTPKKAPRSKFPALLVVALALVALVFVIWRVDSAPSTNDAYASADTIDVVPEVSGRIVELAVTDNQAVKQGDLLFRIDPRPYEANLAKAEASLAALDKQIMLTQRSVDAQQFGADSVNATVEKARAAAKQASDTLRRTEPLLREGFVSAEEVDRARTAQRAAEADLNAVLLQAQSAASSERSSYIGTQMVVTFALATLENVFGPVYDLVEIRDRALGIIIGTVVSAVIYTFVWPESEARTLPQKLAGALGMLSKVMRIPRQQEVTALRTYLHIRISLHAAFNACEEMCQRVVLERQLDSEERALLIERSQTVIRQGRDILHAWDATWNSAQALDNALQPDRAGQFADALEKYAAGVATALSHSPQITLEETSASQAILPTLLKQEQHVCQLFARLPDWTAPALTPATEQAQGATQ